MSCQRPFLQLPYDIKTMVYSHLVPHIVHVRGSYDRIYSTACCCSARVSLDGYWQLLHQEACFAARLPVQSSHFTCAHNRRFHGAKGWLALFLSCRALHDEFSAALQRYASVYSFDEPGALCRFAETAPPSLVKGIGLLTAAWFAPGPAFRPKWHTGSQPLSSSRWKALRHWKAAWKLLMEAGGPRNIQVALLAPHAHLDFVYRHGMLEPFTNSGTVTLDMYYYGNRRTKDLSRCDGELHYRSFEDRVLCQEAS